MTSSDPDAEELKDANLPQDLGEAELMEMLTEVMSIMLFNKDEQLGKYVGTGPDKVNQSGADCRKKKKKK